MGLKLNILYVTFLVLICVCDGDGLMISGTNFRTDPYTHMAFLGRFVFKPNGEGLLYYDIIIPANFCCPDIVIFSDWSKEWPAVRRHGNDMDCYEMIERASMTIHLWDGVGTCEPLEDDIEKMRCKGMKRFEYPLEQWYYVTVMNCHHQQNDGIELLDYSLHLVNNKDGLTKEFSADEDTNLPVSFIFMIVLTLLFIVGFIFGVQLAHQKMLHVTFQLWIGSLLLHTIGILILGCGWLKFAQDGMKREELQSAGHILKAVGTVVFASILVLISKGYTITRLTMRGVGKIKLALFVTGFAVSHVTLYIIKGNADPQDVKNIYDTPAALGLIVIRIIGTSWSLYGIYFTMKDFPSKQAFYSLFTVFVICWFMGEPLVAFLSAFCLPLYCRAKFVFGFDVGVITLGHIIFLCLFRPSSTNTFFPFHLNTNKVGFDFFYDTDPRNNYKPSKVTFDLFLAAKKDNPEEGNSDGTKDSPKETTDQSTDSTKPSNGTYDIFMAGNNGAKKVNCLTKLPTISSTIPIESMINCLVSQPENLPVKNLKKKEPNITISSRGEWPRPPLEDSSQVNDVTYTPVQDLRVKTPRTHRHKHHSRRSSHEAQKRGMHCRPLASEFRMESELPVIEKKDGMDAQKRRIMEMRAALENEETVFQRKLSEANTTSSVEMEMDVEKGDMCVTVKRKKKRRNPIHKATKILGMKKPISAELN